MRSILIEVHLTPRGDEIKGTGRTLAGSNRGFAYYFSCMDRFSVDSWLNVWLTVLLALRYLFGFEWLWA